MFIARILITILLLTSPLYADEIKLYCGESREVAKSLHTLTGQNIKQVDLEVWNYFTGSVDICVVVVIDKSEFQKPAFKFFQEKEVINGREQKGEY